jgi:hypothetical protein
VEVTRADHALFASPAALQAFFFKGLIKDVRVADAQGRLRPWKPTRATGECQASRVGCLTIAAAAQATLDQGVDTESVPRQDVHSEALHQRCPTGIARSEALEACRMAAVAGTTRPRRAAQRRTGERRASGWR